MTTTTNGARPKSPATLKLSSPAAAQNGFHTAKDSAKEKKTQGKNDFLWSNQVEAHARRKKQILRKYGKEINKLMVIEWKTKWICLGVVLTTVLSGAYAINQDSWIVYFLLMYFVSGTCAHNMFLAIHEVTHYTAFKTKFYNDLLAMWCNIPILVPYAMHFKEYHYDHHRYLGWDGIDTDLPTRFEAKLMSTFIGKLIFVELQVFFYAFRPLFVRPLWYNKSRILNLLFIVTSDLILYYLFGWRILVYLFCALVLGSGISPFSGHFLTEHYILDEKSLKEHPNPEAHETHSYYGPLNFFSWNVGFHNEHHDFPNVPWSLLHKLTEMAPEYYKDLPQTDSWFLNQMRFLFKSDLRVWDRIYREEGAPYRKGALIPTTPDTRELGVVASIHHEKDEP